MAVCGSEVPRYRHTSLSVPQFSSASTAPADDDQDLLTEEQSGVEDALLLAEWAASGGTYARSF